MTDRDDILDRLIELGNERSLAIRKGYPLIFRERSRRVVAGSSWIWAYAKAEMRVERESHGCGAWR